MLFIPDTITSIHSPYRYAGCWAYLEEKGQALFGPKFSLYPADGEVLLKLMIWAFGDESLAEKHQLDLHKGILLAGPVGCGKTCLMKLLRWILAPAARYPVKSCREIAFEFAEEGFPVIGRYSKQSFRSFQTNHDEPGALPLCLDDLGLEPAVQHYGNAVNVMAEILLSRHDYFSSHNMLTHMTTNLNSTEIEERYGTRVRSRCRELFNLISFDRTAPDKRC